MKIKIILFLWLFVFSSLLLSLCAQSVDKKVVYAAMHDELVRNKEKLSLAGFKAPFFLSYGVNIATGFDISATLGAVTVRQVLPLSMNASIRLMLGDYHRTSDVGYNNAVQNLALPVEADYDEIRRCFWLATDATYKKELKNYASKQAYLKAHPKSPEEDRLDDFARAEVKSNRVESATEFRFAENEWAEKLAELSAVFKDYPRLFNSSVNFSGREMTILQETSEGAVIEEPLSYVVLSAIASVIAGDGVKISDSWSEIVLRPQDLASLEVLKKKITRFAESLLQLSDIPVEKEFYTGPVLFEEGACAALFKGSLLRPGSLMAARTQEGGEPIFTIDSRVGRRILDTRLSVRNYTRLKTYNNQPLFGAYSVDAEGVVPQEEMVLIENGILKQQLNGRTPTLKAPQSTGSSRFVMANNQACYATAPGTVHIMAEGGMKPEKMKNALLKAAREEGLDYAYIVRKIAGQASLVYRVDVRSGEERQVRVGELAALNLAKLKRLREISSREIVSNSLLNRQVLSSLIYPSAILMEDVEINVPQLKTEKKIALTFPLQRKGF